uniref:Protein odr-4 homolog n=1 Tax=Sphenodon punctatus TaxID=8508 RepID=A0A8D0G823_SPHPU
MGRTYFVEESVGQYLTKYLDIKPKAFITGLLIGQCSPQRDYVVMAIRTPPKEEEVENNKFHQSKLVNIDEEWITAHASQVSRMLPGGLLVLGVFIIAVPELAKDIQNVLHKQRILCRTYDIRDPKSSAKPADWKYQSGLSASWLSLHCTMNVNIHIPLPATSASHELEKNIRNGLTRWAKQIEEGVFLINGQVKEEDAELLEGQSQSSDARSTATVQVCSGSINLKGAVKCRAYINNNKPKVKDAIQVLALKRDIMNTLSDRCEILFEDLLINEMAGKKYSEREYHTLPRRMFASMTGSTVMLCDYEFGDETAGEIQERFVEMLDQAVEAEDLLIAEEMNAGKYSTQIKNEIRLQQGLLSN